MTWVLLFALCDDAPVEFVWSGAVTSTSARVIAKVNRDATKVRLLVSEKEDLSSPVFSEFAQAQEAKNNRAVSLEVKGLKPNTGYMYAVEVDGAVDKARQGTFRTFPEGPASFAFAFGSCARTGSEHPVFATILKHRPLFFVHMGDFHYENIKTNDRALFRQAFEKVLASKAQSELYRSIPIAYMWDDHDYGPNNSKKDSPTRTAACLTYREYAPHYPLPTGDGAREIYQAFTVGRVRFVMTDIHSECDPKAGTMLGAGQKEWFKQELKQAAANFALIVWVNTQPWISAAKGKGWADFAKERKELANFIKAQSIRNLCIISGDAHMLAIDDGSHADYADGGGAPIPVMQAAALDQKGSEKGGPYTSGMFAGGGQFGLMTVTDAGGAQVSVQWSGRNSDDKEIVSHRFTIRK